jgi:predicted glycoside hydrolase/deacetylase ChbG (UPF0249 family)
VGHIFHPGPNGLNIEEAAMRRSIFGPAALLLVLLAAMGISGDAFGASSGIRLIVRGDDMGMTHTANMAIERAFTHGILTCTSVQVPGPRFEEAVEICGQHPEWCVGIHLTYIAEWRGYRWRPVLPWDKVKSIVDEDGFFYPYPDALKPESVNYDELEAELAAQLEMAVKKGLKFHYIDTHYVGAARYPGLAPILDGFSRRYNVPISGRMGEKRGVRIYDIYPPEKTDSLVAILKGLKEPGAYLFVCHPGLYTPENASCVHTDPNHAMKEGIGWHRAEVTRALTSDKVKKVVRDREIELIDYRDPEFTR